MTMIRLAMIGIGGAVLTVITGQCRKEYGVFVLLAAALILNGYIVSDLKVIMDFIKDLSQRIRISDVYLRTLFKLLAISFVSQISSGICEDMGCRSIAAQLEIIGKLSILILSVPIFYSLLETIDQMF